MRDENKRVEVSRRIAAPAAVIFEILANPQRHMDFDGSGTRARCATIEPCQLGGELAMALTGKHARGHIYVVEPTGPFEDDPNVTNKKFPGSGARPRA